MLLLPVVILPVALLTLGCTRVAASRIRCRMPREYVSIGRCWASARSTRSMARSTAASSCSTPRSRPIIRTNSRPFMKP